MTLSRIARQYAKLLEEASTLDEVMTVERAVDADDEYHRVLSKDEKQTLSKVFAERLSSITGFDSRVHQYPPEPRKPNGRRKRPG